MPGTYNHRIKWFDPASGQARRWVGSGRHVSVADTNNHAVRVIDVASADVQTLAIR